MTLSQSIQFASAQEAKSVTHTSTSQVLGQISIQVDVEENK